VATVAVALASGLLLAGVTGAFVTLSPLARVVGCRRPPISPTDVLSDGEASNAVGAAVAARGLTCAQLPPVRMELYDPVDGGRQLLRVSIIAGCPGRVALFPLRWRGSRLDWVGDEAYAGENWVAGRRGGVVFVISQPKGVRWGVPGGLVWLLGTALNRVPARESVAQYRKAA